MLKAQLKAKIDEQKAILQAAIDSGRGMTEEEQAKFDALEMEITGMEKLIEAQNAVEARDAALQVPVNQPAHIEVVENGPPKPFKNLVDQLAAVKNAVTTGRVDERLIQLNNALGASEGIGPDGGFAVQTDYAGLMMETAVKESGILNLVDSYQVTDGADSVKWVDVEESSVATSVFGGVQVYWASEAAAVAATKPQLKEKELKLEKLMGIAYATYELEKDSSFINELYNRAFTLAIRRELENAIIAGDGKGKPLGFLNAGCLVTVAKEGGQAAATILWENISKMYHRAMDKKSPYIWLMHPDAHEQLDFLSFPVGVGGVPVYLPATQQGTIDSLRGKPIYESDHCSVLGTAGDINFVDLSQYMMAYKGGVDAVSSIHVQFLTAENCFRFIFRANGMPKRSGALTIKNSTKTRSPFITLATRA